MNSPSDPGEQERRRRGKRRPAAPAPAGDQNDLFRDPAPPSGPSEGEKRKEKAIEKHENSSRAPLLRVLRNRLKLTYDLRVRKHGFEAFVTADDAATLLKELPVDRDSEGNALPRNWMGALFKEPGWKFTGRTVPSLRPEANGRHVRCWRYEPK